MCQKHVVEASDPHRDDVAAGEVRGGPVDVKVCLSDFLVCGREDARNGKFDYPFLCSSRRVLEPDAGIGAVSPDALFHVRRCGFDVEA